MPDVFGQLPLTDADIAFECAPGDFAALAARCEAVAWGADGAFAPASFVLTSAFPFATQGVQAGHVLVLKKATVNGKSVAEPDALPVLSAADGALTVGRFGYEAGQGAYPRGVSPSAGVTGVEFFVPSLVAQIAREYAEVKRHLGVAGPADVVNPDDIKKVVALEVLADLYYAQWRTAKDDVWKSKLDDTRQQIRAEMDGLRLTYGDETPQGHRPVGGGPADDPAWLVPRAPRPWYRPW